MNNDYFLSFSGHFDRDAGLDQFRLRLDSLSKGCIDVWLATSSISKRQGREAFHARYALLPPDYRLVPKKHYQVNLNPRYQPHTKGIEGNFYQILPIEVKTDRGGTRSHLGIHKDANLPGSLGCIVMSGNRFANFEEQIAKIRNMGIIRIPLLVTYS